MAVIQKGLFYLLLAGGTLLMLLTAGSLIENSSFWFIQILNFPRLGVLIALVVCLLLYVLIRPKQNWVSWLFLGGGVVSAGIQAFILYPYTRLAPTTVASASVTEANGPRVFSILVANVLITNRNADALLKVILDKDPTLIATLEVNDWWVNRLRVLANRYPHAMTYPTANAYGMALYSKQPLTDEQILFLNHDDVPAFQTRVTLPDGYRFQLMVLHPVAPMPSKFPDNVGEKEVALPKAGRMARDLPGPTLVAGDFNDVGWSYNVSRFAQLSGLHDIRRGRGLYNTFDSKVSVFRWPLDHVFVSDEFSVLSIERLPAGGSDHFPLYVQLSLKE